jgi:hypothetical protein
VVIEALPCDTRFEMGWDEGILGKNDVGEAEGTVASTPAGVTLTDVTDLVLVVFYFLGSTTRARPLQIIFALGLSAGNP